MVNRKPTQADRSCDPTGMLAFCFTDSR